MFSTFKKSLSIILVLSFVFAILSQSFSFAITDKNNSFVKTNGTEFSLNNEKFYFMGTNINDLALLQKNGSKTTNNISSELKVMAASGLKVVRFWSCLGETLQSNDLGVIRETNPSRNVPMINDDGTLNETALKTLDFTMAELSNNNLKALFTFVNFEFWQNPMDFFVQKYVGGAPGEKPKELFFTDSRCKEAYKAFVKAIINRRNTVNGRIYRDDPTIFAWELCNEPHTTDDYETTLGIKPGTIVFNWLNEMSAFVKSIDKNHMITTGEEGYRTNGPQLQRNAWLNNGLKGVDFERNTKQLSNVDFATLHVYPDNWAIPYQERTWVFENYINDRMKIGIDAKKPVIIEESGYRLSYGDRDTLLNEIYNYANKIGIAGTMIWSFRERFPDFQMYDFYPGAPGTAAVLQQAQYMNELSKSSRSLTSDSKSLGFPQYSPVIQNLLGFSNTQNDKSKDSSIDSIDAGFIDGNADFPGEVSPKSIDPINSDSKPNNNDSAKNALYLSSTLTAALIMLKKKVGNSKST